MYVYDCIGIMKNPTKNRSDKEMIRAFKELRINLKICGINPGLHIMDN